MTWGHAMERARKLAQYEGCRYRVTAHRHTFRTASVWLYHVEPVR